MPGLVGLRRLVALRVLVGPARPVLPVRGDDVRRAARLLVVSWVGTFLFGAVAAHRNRDRRPHVLWCSRHHGPWLMVEIGLTERQANLASRRFQRTADNLGTGAVYTVTAEGERPVRLGPATVVFPCSR